MAIKQVVNQGCYVIDIHSSITIHICSIWQDITSQHAVNQGSHIIDIHLAIAIHVTTRGIIFNTNYIFE